MSKARDLANAGTALTTVSATELGYLDGVTSAVQTQIDSKQAVVSGVNDTEIGYLDGVTSAIQTQINSKIGQSTAINPSTVTAKGDLLVATGSGTIVAQPVGSNGQVLTADSAEADGVKWATPAASGGMTVLLTGSFSGTSTSMGTIPSGYKDIVIIARSISMSANDQLRLRINGSSSAIYHHTMINSGATTISNSTNAAFMDVSTASTMSASGPHNYNVTIRQYSATGWKNIEVSGSIFKPATHYPILGNGMWASTDAVTSVQIYTNGGTSFTGGSYTVYGVN